MAARKQVWRPLTCACVLTVEYHDADPDATFTGVAVKACPAHAGLTAHQAYTTILAAQRASLGAD